MKTGISSFIVGFIFALGLGISGMTQPQKVVGFLNFFGIWDPSLLFVMLSSIGVHFFAFRFILKRKSPLFSTKWNLPTKTEITPALVAGAIIFGIGWGLGGYCPGPAIVSLGHFELKPLLFLISMIFGMLLIQIIDKKMQIRK